ncbi:hypothetical protein [Methylobacterium sp. SI9]|uniref:hypothetical protein n=1 Tax=Methylobacterium guangdongense TaxID=3138811 RepID=UPI00313D843B
MKSRGRRGVGAVVTDRAGEISVRRPTRATLPRLTLYAHGEVVRAVRVVAAQDGVQAQEILRRAVRAYLRTRGHAFTDLSKGV